MRYLGPEDLRAALPMSDAIDAMADAFGDDTEAPLRSRLGTSLVMPGRVGAVTGVKMVSVVPGNPAGLVAVVDEGGDPIGWVDGPTLTAIRTGAASGLATHLLAPNQPVDLAMLGAGAMAADQIEAIRCIRRVRRVVVWSRTESRARFLAARCRGEATTAVSEAVAGASVICCATPSVAPLFDDVDLAVDGRVHINAIGSFTPEMVEVPAATMRRAYVVVDDLAGCLAEAGDLIQADRSPDATVNDLLAERTAPPAAAVTVFKSVGVATQDVAAAARALRRAEESDIGISWG